MPSHAEPRDFSIGLSFARRRHAKISTTIPFKSLLHLLLVRRTCKAIRDIRRHSAPPGKRLVEYLMGTGKDTNFGFDLQ